MALAKVVPATKDAPPALTPEEAQAVSTVVTRPETWLRRFMSSMTKAFKLVERSEFDAICLAAWGMVNGKTMLPEEAAKRVKRMIEAYTYANASVICPKCDISD